MSEALIVGDLQRGITDRFEFTRQVLTPVGELLPRARAAGALVVHVQTAFRVNRADLPPDSPLFAAFFEAADVFHEGSPGIEPALPVEPADVVVRKRRASAFAGTDLDLVLRARGVTAVTLTGVATSAMVAATAYDAADRGYRVSVPADGCADEDPAVHEFFVERVFPGRGFEVRDCAGWG
ncbi:isochorismatase family cysteine hydrolase [Amycolatopsis sp.]|uniref:cysteine hydrolase family protein n=1 Tax=Amycolatopsis sp. TaxID=37632 RepID=UPI002D7E481D|nr:isochorismatase family cysteine hydrolase [Amycolatopsis sp.]HET6704202.1 isochorismatase family cysteine hydrolase [Amycolatopsis sp.]